MTRVLLILVAALGLLLGAVLWRLDHVTSERDVAVDLVERGAAAVASLRGTLALQRDLANDQAAITVVLVVVLASVALFQFFVLDKRVHYQ